ncbi:MAG TPA: multicopper oxidase domain-containing protein, partial [Candidatus Sulfotelmatobacter sp.]|nr:multicopper oxidase domain-containing protein [Candidatus Sulfotelmatobacter sp.]
MAIAIVTLALIALAFAVPNYVAIRYAVFGDSAAAPGVGGAAPGVALAPAAVRRKSRFAAMVRQNFLMEIDDPEFPARLKLLLNGMDWNELPITETPYNGTVEVWELYNLTGDTHPIHLHLVQFQILNREPIEVDENGNLTIIGPAREPDPNERGWKDTVRANPNEVTRIIARF